MEKILLVVDTHKPDTASIQFACRIAAGASSKLTGLFVENLYERRPERSNVYFQPTPEKPEKDKADVEVMDTDQALKLFVQECSVQKVKAETYVDKGEPIQEVIYESRFADLLIVDPKMSYYGIEDHLPSHFVKEILAGAECPVLLAPDQYGEADEVVFCYDGSASSVYAIKQFTYLLPQMRNKKAVLLEVNKSGKEEFGEDHRRLMAWLQAHYGTVNFRVLKGRAKDELFTFFFMQQNIFVVMGSYGRSQLSNFFKHSTADVLIRTVDVPLFITHNE
jgi:nucleotide-binding universal stress UspA family protein